MKLGELRLLLYRADRLEDEIHEQKNNDHYPHEEKQRELDELEETEVT